MSENNVIMYDKSIIKKMKDIEYGDIIEIDDGSIKTTGVYLLNHEPFEGYSLRDSGDKVIGKYLGEVE